MSIQEVVEHLNPASQVPEVNLSTSKPESTKYGPRAKSGLFL
jgi:hypothetical protein